MILQTERAHPISIQHNDWKTTEVSQIIINFQNTGIKLQILKQPKRRNSLPSMNWESNGIRLVNSNTEAGKHWNNAVGIPVWWEIIFYLEFYTQKTMDEKYEL